MSLGSRTGRDGFVAWIEGLPVSGKSTLARALRDRLDADGVKVEILDGDEVRQMFSPELGFSRKDREFHARRVSYVARILARNGVAVLVAMITPYETSRQAARATVGGRFAEIWLRCPIEVCRRRDTKGLYGPQGGRGKVTGVDDPFEEPLNPELVVDTAEEPPEASAEKILAFLRSRGYLPPPTAAAPAR
jgi:adenylylsulfate kinase